MPTRVYYAPDEVPASSKINLFLAGSIDMGRAVDWQNEVINGLNGLTIDIYNPRRFDWDSTWVQSIDNPLFKSAG
jgi:hypothetical protein